MLEQNLNVLIPAEFVFLKNRKWNGAYNHETRKKLYGIIEKLQRGKRNRSREEKKLYRLFRNANFGILLDKNSKTREKLSTPEWYRFWPSLRRNYSPSGSYRKNSLHRRHHCRGNGDV